MSGSQAAVYTNPFRTLGIRLDRLGQAGLPAVVRSTGQAEAPRWGMTPSLKIDDLCCKSQQGHVRHLPSVKPCATVMGVVSRWGLRHLPPPVPSVPPHPSLPCLVTWLTIHLGEKTLPEHAWCTTLLSVLAMRQGAGPWPARAPLHQQRGQTTGRPNN